MRRFLAALLMCGAVMGQTTIVMSKPPKAPGTIVQLAKKLKRSQGAAWLLLDAPKADWVAGFRGLLGQDEDLMVLGLPLESYGPKTPLAAELRTQQGWGPEAAWALLGPGARVLGSGKTLPTARQLLDLAEGNGIRGELRDLESFVARHPGHVQAYRQLLVSHFGLAGRRTHRLVKPTMKKDAEGNPLPPEYPQPLTEADDERVWGRAAALLLPYVQSGDWRLANGGLIVAFQEAGQASPLLRAAALKTRDTTPTGASGRSWPRQLGAVPCGPSWTPSCCSRGTDGASRIRCSPPMPGTPGPGKTGPASSMSWDRAGTRRRTRSWRSSSSATMGRVRTASRAPGTPC